MGAPRNAVVVGLSCTGVDAIALCLGAIFAFPAVWSARLWGGMLGLLLITAVNVVRIGTLAFAAENGSLLHLLHVYVWPALLIVVVTPMLTMGVLSGDRRDGKLDFLFDTTAYRGEMDRLFGANLRQHAQDALPHFGR